ncbi:MAG: hypothetical protein E2604_01655 [Flavobacterium sp.]|nr:hypothetical protein [Flavobacterium sp.]
MDHLIATDLFEKLGLEVIIGIEGERVVNSRDFYSVFTTEVNFKVINSGNTIGDVPLSEQIQEEENILLAAKIWKIVGIDFKAKKIEVIPANDGKPPRFFGNGGAIDSQIREKMLEILYSTTQYEFLNEECLNAVHELRKEFTIFPITDIRSERPLLTKENKLELFMFAGTHVNRTLELLLRMQGITVSSGSGPDSLKMDHKDEANFGALISNLSDVEKKMETYITENLPEGDLPDSKFGHLLPVAYQTKLILEKFYKIEEGIAFLKQLKTIRNPENSSAEVMKNHTL